MKITILLTHKIHNIQGPDSIEELTVQVDVENVRRISKEERTKIQVNLDAILDKLQVL